MATGTYRASGYAALATCSHVDNKPCKHDAAYLIDGKPCCTAHANLTLADALSRNDQVTVTRP